jgi:hypothetical protein
MGPHDETTAFPRTASWTVPSPGAGRASASTAPQAAWPSDPGAPASSWGAPAPAAPPPGWPAPAAAPAPTPWGPAPQAWAAPGWGGPGGAVWPAPVPPPSSRGGLWAALAASVVMALAAVAFLAVAVVASGEDEPAAAVVAPPAASTPTPGPDGRLAPPPPIPTADGPHSFVDLEPDGDPVAWDPCDPIPYVVNPRLAPEGAEGILHEAIAEVEAATGLVFVDEGTTDEVVPVGDQGRADTDPARYGDGWSPVLISWTDAEASPDLEGNAGLALPSWQEAASGERVYVTGYIEMAGDYAAGLLAQGQRDDVVGIMMHELGHLVGLGHVDPADQVMTDDPSSTPREWGAGDLAGLAAVGRGECEPDV